ncbi:MAG: hypothetical protein VKL41_20685 [Snowella sp.]|nr:hypothetical protein [Snowella sp.]
MTEFATVDVKCITSDVSRSTFSEQDIEKLADSILKNDSLLRPLILKQTGIENFVVLDGHLEFYAAVRAREKNPRQAEMINSFVISPKDESTVNEQISFLRQSDKFIDLSSKTEKTEGISNWITSFENRLTEMREVIFQNNQSNESRFKQLETNLDKKSKENLLDVINISKKEVLIQELSRYGLPKKKVEAIYDAREQKKDKKFENYSDVVKSTKGKGFGVDAFISLIDAWENSHK